jgi:hypothetical protein
LFILTILLVGLSCLRFEPLIRILAFRGPPFCRSLRHFFAEFERAAKWRAVLRLGFNLPAEARPHFTLPDAGDAQGAAFQCLHYTLQIFP